MPIPKPMEGYVVEDDLLAPKRTIVIEYFGKNPFAVYSRMRGWLQGIFHTKGKDIFEPQFRWDLTADPRPFYFTMYVERQIDRFTFLYVRLTVFGAQPSDPDKSGRLHLEIRGSLLTQFPTGTRLQKLFLEPFVWAYYHAIYKNARRGYFKLGKEGVERLEAVIRDTLGIPMRERLT